jgi:WD40 repeat protein
VAGRSFAAASATSLSDLIVLGTLRRDESQAGVSEQVVLHRPTLRQSDVLTLASSRSSMALLSPDGSRIAYGTASLAGVNSSVRILDVRSKTETIISVPQDANFSGGWVQLPMWRSDGQAVLALLISRKGRAALSRLFVISLRTQQVTEYLNADSGISAACFSPTNGNILLLTVRGLELFDPETKAISLITPRSVFLNGRYSGGGLAWSRSSGLIALPLASGNSDELWVLKSDGSDPHVIFRADNARLTSVTFAWGTDN